MDVSWRIQPTGLITEQSTSLQCAVSGVLGSSSQRIMVAMYMGGPCRPSDRVHFDSYEAHERPLFSMGIASSSRLPRVWGPLLQSPTLNGCH